jgi:hypothetical protein
MEKGDLNGLTTCVPMRFLLRLSSGIEGLLVVSEGGRLPAAGSSGTYFLGIVRTSSPISSFPAECSPHATSLKARRIASTC